MDPQADVKRSRVSWIKPKSGTNADAAPLVKCQTCHIMDSHALREN